MDNYYRLIGQYLNQCEQKWDKKDRIEFWLSFYNSNEIKLDKEIVNERE